VNPTVLVIGATGKTGRHLVPRLARRGVTVRSASRHPAPAEAGVEPLRFDWDDFSTYAAALNGARALYLVTPTYVVDPTKQVETLLGEAAEAGVERVVLLSALGVDQADPGLPARRIEILAESSGIPATMLRPAAFMENFSERHWAGSGGSIRTHGELRLPGAGTQASYVSTRDIAAVAAIALTEDGHGGKGYTLTGPEALTLADVARIISVAAGRPVRHVDGGVETVHDALVADGAPEDFAAYMTELYRMTLLSGAMSPVTFDVTAVTGRPPINFSAYATVTADTWRP
jgi:uncharacterized protein YbjT (DUF2867 family)